MNDESPTAGAPPRDGARPSIWQRLFPFYAFAIALAFLLFRTELLHWLEADIRLGFVGALVAIGLLFIALLGVPIGIALIRSLRRGPERSGV
jgi:hypothetical protein